MSQLKRMCLATALLLGVALTVSALAGPGEIDQHKRDVVRLALARLGSSEGGPSLVEAAGKAHALVDIDVAGPAASPRVRLQLTGRPTYNVFAMDHGRKVVVDLYDTVNLRAGTVAIDMPGAPLRQLRTSLFALTPRFVSRVVIELERPLAFDVAWDEEQLTVALCPAPGSPTPSTEATPDVERDKLAALRRCLEEVREAQRLEMRLDRLARELKRLGAPSEVLAEADPPESAAPETESAAPADDFPIVAKASERSRDVQYRLDRIHSGLEAVRVSQFDFASQSDLVGSPQVMLAAVTEEGAEEEKADAEADNKDEKPAAPDAKAAPAPPAARSSTSKPTGPPVMQRMKQVLSGITEQRKGQLEEATGEPAQPKPAQASKPGPPAKKPTPLRQDQAKPVARVVQDAPKSVPPPIVGDPLEQIVTIDFREFELSNVVALLAQKANINVIAGADLAGVVTANLKNVTLRQAMETALRMNGLGMIEEEGIYHIVPYDEALAAERVTKMITLDNAKAEELQKTLLNVLQGAPDDALVSISFNTGTNVLIIAGPQDTVHELMALAKDLDIAKPVAPTVTEAIRLNNAEPDELSDLVKGMLTPEIGQVAVDTRTRHLVVTDVPVVIEQVREVLLQLDLPVKQVSIDTMVVDAILGDDSQTGVDWIINSVQKVNKRGVTHGSLEQLESEVDSTGRDITPATIGLPSLAHSITFGVLTGDIDLRGLIGAEVSNQNAKLLANPIIVTVENKEAQINITEEIPYQELTQSTTGPPMSTTAFKDVGIVLTVTPRVTHDDHIISDLNVKQSDTKGEVNNIPVEDKRETQTTLRTRNGQTVFIGGLRRFDDEYQTKKVPVLGDIPIMGVLFKNNIVRKESTELLVFLTCNVLPDELDELGPELQAAHDELEGMEKAPDSQKTLWQSIANPKSLKPDPAWKWRRSK